MAGDALAVRGKACDRLLGGRLVFTQPADGYRAAVDGLLIAAFACPGAHAAADLGAGAGMISLALLARDTVVQVVAIERDPVLAGFLEENLAANDFSRRSAIIRGDVFVTASARRGSVDLVVSNPPFWHPARVTPATHPRARTARSGGDSEGGGDSEALPRFVRAARALLGRGGSACFIWPASDLPHILDVAASAGLHAKRIRFVHPLPGRPAKRVMLELKAGRAGGMSVDAPLLLEHRIGVPSAEALDILGLAVAG